MVWFPQLGRCNCDTESCRAAVHREQGAAVTAAKARQLWLSCTAQLAQSSNLWLLQIISLLFAVIKTQCIDTLHSLAAITQQCRNSTEHVKGNQPLAQLNSGKHTQIWGEKPNPYFSKEKLSTNRICKTWLRGSVSPTHLIHCSCRCGYNSPWQGTAASVNTSHRKKMSPFQRVEHKVKSTSVEDRDIMAEGEQGRL